MDSTGKLAPGIVGVTVCMILVVAVALPVMGAMIGLVDQGELGPGEVTESGANAFDPSYPTFNYVEAPSRTSAYGWAIVKLSEGWEVRYILHGGTVGSSSVDSYTMIVPAASATDTGRITASSDTVVIELEGVSHSYALSPGSSINVSYMYAAPFSAYIVMVEASVVDSGGTHLYPYQFDGVPFVFTQHVDGMPAATHGYVSGSPSAVIGDGAADSKAFKIDVPAGNSKTVVDMTDAVGLDQRVFMLDDGRLLDLDDSEEPVKAPTREDVGGPVLKTSRAAAYTAIMVQRSGVYDMGAAADVTTQYAVSWGEYQAPNDLEAPLLESVSKGGSPLTGWYVPISWTYTGDGTVLKESTIYTVLSILPAVLVVALFILVARWAMAERGDGETRAFLGKGPGNDGWRDRR